MLAVRVNARHIKIKMRRSLLSKLKFLKSVVRLWILLL